MPVVDDDPFCEQAMWAALLNSNSTLFIKNPVAAVTGALMIPIGLVPTGEGPPLFMLCKAALCITGIGTAVFHSMSPAQASASGINYRLYDWLAITLMCANIILLYLSNLLARAGEAATIAVGALYTLGRALKKHQFSLYPLETKENKNQWHAL